MMSILVNATAYRRRPATWVQGSAVTMATAWERVFTCSFLRTCWTCLLTVVLAQLRRGRSNKEIAAHLGVSITTVNKHVQQVPEAVLAEVWRRQAANRG